MKRFSWVLFGMLCSLIPSNGYADIVFDLALRVPTQSASLDGSMEASPGAVISGVQLLLIETVSGGSTSILGNNSLDSSFVPNRNGNILAFQANLLAVGSDGSFSNLLVTSLGGVPNPNNDSNTVGFFALGNFASQPGVLPVQTGINTYEALLGTVDLRAPTSGQTVFTLADFSLAPGDFSTFSTGSLEQAALNSGGSFNNRSLTITTTAVPEPSSLALMGVGAMALVLRRRRLQAL